MSSIFETVSGANDVVQTLLTDEMKMELNEQVYKTIFYQSFNIYCSNQGYKGMRQLPINRCTSPMMTHKNTPFVKLVVETFKHLT